jgi:hypothetical protein
MHNEANEVHKITKNTHGKLYSKLEYTFPFLLIHEQILTQYMKYKFSLTQ